MARLTVLRNCGASGRSLEAGRVYAVPEEVSQADARILVQIGKAAYHEDSAEPAPTAADRTEHAPETAPTADEDSTSKRRKGR